MIRGSTRFGAFACVATLFALGIASCNAISGVDDYQFPQGSGGAASASSSSEASGSSGSGGTGGSIPGCGFDEKSCDGTCRADDDLAFGCADPLCNPCNVLGNMAACCGGSCVDLTLDANNCGECYNDCYSDEYCQDGSCVCRPGLTPGSEGCVDLASDHENCGAVGTVCVSPSPKCQGGTCVAQCSGVFTDCSDHCVDTSSDPLFCGSCFDSACEEDEVCVSGDCHLWIPGSSVGCSSCPCPDCPEDYQCSMYPGTSMVICVEG
jgi:hypothetical protein